jgi:putative sporulation protein YyaC
MDTLPETQPCLVRRRHQDPTAAAELSLAVRHLLAGFAAGPDVVVVCIGTDRSTGDSLGPLTGLELVGRGYPPELVYGTIDEPVHAANLLEAVERVQRTHPGATIIAVDACLGVPENVGSISVSEGPLRPGAGVNKSLPPVGEVAVTGVVNVAGFMEYFVLQNTRLSLVMSMARVIAQAIVCAVGLIGSAGSPASTAEVACEGQPCSSRCARRIAVTSASPT